LGWVIQITTINTSHYLRVLIDQIYFLKIHLPI